MKIVDSLTVNHPPGKPKPVLTRFVEHGAYLQLISPIRMKVMSGSIAETKTRDSEIVEKQF